MLLARRGGVGDAENERAHRSVPCPRLAPSPRRCPECQRMAPHAAPCSCAAVRDVVTVAPPPLRRWLKGSGPPRCPPLLVALSASCSVGWRSASAARMIVSTGQPAGWRAPGEPSAGCSPPTSSAAIVPAPVGHAVPGWRPPRSRPPRPTLRHRGGGGEPQPLRQWPRPAAMVTPHGKPPPARGATRRVVEQRAGWWGHGSRGGRRRQSPPRPPPPPTLRITHASPTHTRACRWWRTAAGVGTRPSTDTAHHTAARHARMAYVVLVSSVMACARRFFTR